MKKVNKAERIETIMEVVRIVAGLLIAYAVALLILMSISKEPLYIIKQFVLGPFSSPRRIGSIVNLAVPFTICGLSMCFMYAVNKFNLIGEGIFMLSGCVITWAGLAMADMNIPMGIMVPVLLCIGALVGIVLSFIPAIMDRKFKANVVVVSLMLNSVVAEIALYILRYKIKDSSISFVGSYETPLDMRLPSLFGQFKIGAGVIIALIAVVIISILFFKTPFGWKMRLVGSNPRFAMTVGISTMSISFAAQLAGSALAGIGGATEIMNKYTRFQWTATTGHGFDGLLVAVLARRNPALVPVGALFLAYIRIGADVVNTSGDIPSEFVTVIQGIIILLVGAESFLSGTRNKMIYRAVQKDQELAQAESSKKAAVENVKADNPALLTEEPTGPEDHQDTDGAEAAEAPLETDHPEEPDDGKTEE